MRLRRVAAVALAAGGVLSACGLGGHPSGVVTNPPGGGALMTSSASATGGEHQTSGVRTVLAPLGLNLRSTDSPSGTLLGTVAQGTVLNVLDYSDKNGGWYRVHGDTTSGWITANPQFSSPHRFNLFQSDQHAFTALYREGWAFSEDQPAVVFRPQSGGQAIVVRLAQSLDAVGPPGRDGYTVSATDTVEVFGVTGTLRIYTRTGTINPSPDPDQPPPLSRLAEIRITIDSTRAMRLDFGYDTPGDLQDFRDFFNSVAFPPPATPGPSGSAGASPSAAPSEGATPTPT